MFAAAAEDHLEAGMGQAFPVHARGGAGFAHQVGYPAGLGQFSSIGQPVLQVVPPLCIPGMSPNAFRRLGYSDVNQAALIS